MTNERKLKIVDNMLEYLDNYGVEFENIGIYDSTENDEVYNICLGYIVELVENNGDAYFFESVLGFTKEELVAEGMEWIYDDYMSRPDMVMRYLEELSFPYDDFCINYIIRNWKLDHEEELDTIDGFEIDIDDVRCYWLDFVKANLFD